MTELLSCPFCNGSARHVVHTCGNKDSSGYDAWRGVSCRICHACVGASDRRFRTIEEAAKAWNMRPKAMP